ncbi:sugar kinase [Leucobacter sp. M11]|uniref:sugar kinase n=1 Tax=Leucobacter sp. M11 TaxID=2993565 RepID=UPI002D7ED533|nr:sugar kinase [Leucobacter sp. M11]MEB4614567.1 sugar kinase [Leucobacter sp. M11]
MSHAPDVMSVGETLVMVTPNAGGRIDVESTFVLRPGGAESNVAVLMSELGHSAVWASRLGTDPFGDLITAQLSEAGVDLSQVQRSDDFRTAVYFKDPGETATTVYYYREGSAAAQMTRADAEAWTQLRPRVLHLSGITPALSAGCQDLVHYLLGDRPIPDALVSFDVNYRPGLWGVTEAAPQLLAFAQRSDIVFVGRDEAERLWGTATPEAIRALISAPGHLVIKDGAHEAVAYAGETMTRVPAPTVDVVEVVGAGDAFAAGWLSGLVRNRSAVDRLRLGHYVASRVLRSPSDTVALPDAGTIEETIREDPSRWRGLSGTPREETLTCPRP